MNTDVCPHCAVSLHDPPQKSRAIGHEIRGVYDGVLFESCPDCAGTWHRWDPIRDAGRWAAAEQFRARHTIQECEPLDRENPEGAQ